MKNLIEATRALKEAQKNLLEVAQKEGRNGIGQAFFPLLEKWRAEVAHVGWTQYTPFFNDGDSCTFSVHGFCIVPVGEDDMREHEIWGAWNKDYSKHSKECHDEFLAVWNEIKDNDLFLAVFGDHVEVKIYAGRVEVEEYSHE